LADLYPPEGRPVEVAPWQTVPQHPLRPCQLLPTLCRTEVGVGRESALGLTHEVGDSLGPVRATYPEAPISLPVFDRAPSARQA
jgi:hypothetical protein